MNLEPQKEETLKCTSELDYSTWKEGKQFDFPNCSVKTFHYTQNNEKWFARQTFLDASQYSFHDFAKYIVGAVQSSNGTWSIPNLDDHTKYEAQYIPLIYKWSSASTKIPNCYRATIQYKLQTPLKHREFNEYIIVEKPIVLSNGDYEANVISVVADAPVLKNQNCVRGAYASVEKIKFLRDSNQIEWIMTVASNAGGSVPKWLQSKSIPKSISHDVPCFLDWLNTIKNSPGQQK